MDRFCLKNGKEAQLQPGIDFWLESRPGKQGIQAVHKFPDAS